MLNKKGLSKIILLLVSIMLAMPLAGCDDSKEADSKTIALTKTPKDSYADYIHDALEEVSKDAAPELEEQQQEETGKVIHIGQEAIDPTEIYVSASDSDENEIYNVEASDEDNEQQWDDSDDDMPSMLSQTDPVANMAEESTPDEFDVGTSCIYINGERDATYGEDVIAAINKARTDLGFTALNPKTSLTTCADRRTREIACYLNHTRPNNQPFYSLAPQYFKAEMLAIDNATAEETVDAWIKDLVSRNLVFTTKFTSIGASCFKCNGLKCVVVAFGY